jgi:hypothetical protein
VSQHNAKKVTAFSAAVVAAVLLKAEKQSLLLSSSKQTIWLDLRFLTPPALMMPVLIFVQACQAR